MKNKRTKSLAEIVQILKDNYNSLKEKFQIKEIGVFGSYVRGEETKRSDIDILVEFEPGHKTFDNYMETKFFLEDLLGLKVDLIMKSAIRNEIKEAILEEVIYA